MPVWSRVWMALAALAGASGVALSAYAAHGLGFIADPALRETARATLRTATDIQLLHALALLAVGLWTLQRPAARLPRLAGLLFALGIVLFSGLIYLRIFSGYDGLRGYVPWGGSSLILAWLTLLAAALSPTPSTAGHAP
jgi:uncharacterized membrane protein YgdD (TMEM256/DUF423 family)